LANWFLCTNTLYFATSVPTYKKIPKPLSDNDFGIFAEIVLFCVRCIFETV